MLTQIFESVIVMSLFGSLLALFWLMIKPLTGSLFGPKWQYYVWLTVLVVMLLPLRIDISDGMISHSDMVTDKISDMPITTDESVQNDAYKTWDVSEYIQDTIAPKKILHFNFFDFLGLIWLIGALTAFLVKIIKYRAFLHTILKNSVGGTVPFDIPKRLAVYKTDMLDAPLMLGLFKPRLFLPSAELGHADLRLILMHELTHYKRKDILYKWISMAVQCIHWFNPIVYIVSRQIDLSCEISCDYAVTIKLDDDEQRGYMNMILNLIVNSNLHPILLTTQMAGSKKILQRRFAMIKKKIRINKRITVLSVALAVVVLATTVFASGILNGKLFNQYGNPTSALNMDEPVNNNFNLLLVGVDKRNRADTVMLAAVRENSLDVISIPRNTLVDGKRLSDLFSDEDGNQKLIDAVKHELSVPVNYYAQIDLTAMEKIVDELGGVEFDVPIDMNYDDPHQDLHINLKKGVQVLDGKSACDLLQFRRGYTEGDISRIQIGQEFVKELLRQKCTSENIDKFPQIYKIVLDNIKTNYPINNPKQIMNLTSAIGSSEINLDTIPGKNEVYAGVLVYEIDRNSIENITGIFSNGL